MILSIRVLQTNLILSLMSTFSIALPDGDIIIRDEPKVPMPQHILVQWELNVMDYSNITTVII